MLALENPHWGELQHAYGTAGDIPDLLRAVEAAPGPAQSSEDAPWHGLWSRLCHQDDVYTASYAAVPHIVRIGLATEGPIDFSLLQLPAAVEVARRTGRGPGLPPDLADAYLGAIAGLVELVSRHRHEPWDRPMLLSVAAALAVAKHHIDVAGALLNLDNDLIAALHAQNA